MNNFIKEADRLDALEYVTEQADKMTKTEIIIYLINNGFKEAKAWEIADKLKTKGREIAPTKKNKT